MNFQTDDITMIKRRNQANPLDDPDISFQIEKIKSQELKDAADRVRTAETNQVLQTQMKSAMLENAPITARTAEFDPGSGGSMIPALSLRRNKLDTDIFAEAFAEIPQDLNRVASAGAGSDPTSTQMGMVNEVGEVGRVLVTVISQLPTMIGILQASGLTEDAAALKEVLKLSQMAAVGSSKARQLLLAMLPKVKERVDQLNSTISQTSNVGDIMMKKYGVVSNASQWAAADPIQRHELLNALKFALPMAKYGDCRTASRLVDMYSDPLNPLAGDPDTWGVGPGFWSDLFDNVTKKAKEGIGKMVKGMKTGLSGTMDVLSANPIGAAVSTVAQGVSYNPGQGFAYNSPGTVSPGNSNPASNGGNYSVSPGGSMPSNLPLQTSQPSGEQSNEMEKFLREYSKLSSLNGGTETVFENPSARLYRMKQLPALLPRQRTNVITSAETNGDSKLPLMVSGLDFKFLSSLSNSSKFKYATGSKFDDLPRDTVQGMILRAISKSPAWNLLKRGLSPITEAQFQRYALKSISMEATNLSPYAAAPDGTNLYGSRFSYRPGYLVNMPNDSKQYLQVNGIGMSMDGKMLYLSDPTTSQTYATVKSNDLTDSMNAYVMLVLGLELMASAMNQAYYSFVSSNGGLKIDYISDPVKQIAAITRASYHFGAAGSAKLIRSGDQNLKSELLSVTNW